MLSRGYAHSRGKIITGGFIPALVFQKRRRSHYQHALAEIEKVNAFAKQWRISQRQPALETDSLAGGCALVKREVLQKLGLFPTRTPLGVFDLEGLGNRVRQAGYRLRACFGAYVHNFASRDRASR